MEIWIYLALAILLANTIEAATGFGSIVIAVSIGALFMPIPTMLPILVPLSVVVTSILVWRNRRHIHWPTFLYLIVPFMLTGLVIGVTLLTQLDNRWLKLAFSLLVIWFASRSLWQMITSDAPPAHPLWLTRILVFGAGITHGMFASGGPLLVYGLAGQTLSKAQFRASLLLVWLMMNACLTSWFIWTGRFMEHMDKFLLYLPVVGLGAWLGNVLHHRIPDLLFRKLVLGLLMLTGTLLLISSL